MQSDGGAHLAEQVTATLRSAIRTSPVTVITAAIEAATPAAVARACETNFPDAWGPTLVGLLLHRAQEVATHGAGMPGVQAWRRMAPDLRAALESVAHTAAGRAMLAHVA